MLVQSFSKVFILIDYQANKEYIMEFLCINRDKPELGCEGKCHLSKQLKAQDEADKQTNKQNQKSEVQVQLFCQSLFSLQVCWLASVEKSLLSYTAGHPTQAAYGIFHPPKSIA
jgi:hypothetical protein